MQVSEHQILLFFLIVVRMTSMLLTAPVFSSRSIPIQYKLGFSGILSFLLFPLADTSLLSLELTFITTVIYVFKEMMVGVCIGFAMALLFAGIQLAGEYVSLDMGLTMAQVFDPESGTQTSVIGRLHNILAMLIFLILNGHHFLIEAVAYSYSVLPVGTWEFSMPALEVVARLSAEVFVVAIKVAAPAVVALFLTSVGMGIIARTVPQMNIFFVGFPLRILVGFVFMTFSFSIFVLIFEKLLNNFQGQTALLLQVL